MKTKKKVTRKTKREVQTFAVCRSSFGHYWVGTCTLPVNGRNVFSSLALARQDAIERTECRIMHPEEMNTELDDLKRAGLDDPLEPAVLTHLA